MDRKNRLLWADRLRIGFLVGMLIAAMLAYAGSLVGMISLFVLLAGFLAVEFTMNRCPHCDHYLDRNRSRFCQHCGGRVREEKANT